MSDNTFDRNVKCGHERPDSNTDHLNSDPKRIFTQQYEIAFNLELPSLVYLNAEKKGSWTMVYDEGVEIKINGYVFFAFLKYNAADYVVATNTDTSETKGYSSDCSRTFTGWFHDYNTNKNWGCFYMHKITTPSKTYGDDIFSAENKTTDNSGKFLSFDSFESSVAKDLLSFGELYKTNRPAQPSYFDFIQRLSAFLTREQINSHASLGYILHEQHDRK